MMNAPAPQFVFETKFAPAADVWQDDGFPPAEAITPSRRAEREPSPAFHPGHGKAARSEMPTKDSKAVALAEPPKMPTKDGKPVANAELAKQSRQKAKPPKTPPAARSEPVPVPLGGKLIPATMTGDEIAKIPVAGVEENRYIVAPDSTLADSGQRQRFLVERLEKLLANHLLDKYGLADDDWAMPSLTWLQNARILQGGYPWSSGRENVILNVAPSHIEMVYNHHLGSLRTLTLAKGYAGGVLILGGLALLLRIGTGIRPRSPPNKV
jgi:hypothetical protein